MSLVSIKQANAAANGTKDLLNLVFQNSKSLSNTSLNAFQKIELAKSIIKRITENPDSEESKTSIQSIIRLSAPSLASNTSYYSDKSEFALKSREDENKILNYASDVMLKISIHNHIQALDEQRANELGVSIYNTFKSIDNLAATPNKKSKLLLSFQEDYFAETFHNSELIKIYRQVEREYCHEVYRELLKPFAKAVKETKAVNNNNKNDNNPLMN